MHIPCIQSYTIRKVMMTATNAVSMNMMTVVVLSRKTKYSEDDEIIIVKEVCTSKAYIVGDGKIIKLFRKAADRENINPNLFYKR